MRTELKYRKVHKACKGTGDCPLDAESHSTIPDHDRPLPCESCNGLGYTEETMEFNGDALDTQGGSWDYLEINGSNILRQFPDLKWVAYDAYSKIITKDLNPQSLHIYEEKECPYCEGKGMINTASFSGETNYCKSCNRTGKIEIETSFTVFKSKEEYDAEIWKEAREIIKDEFKNIKAELNSEQPVRQSGGENNK